VVAGMGWIKYSEYMSEARKLEHLCSVVGVGRSCSS
jgi:hypothetical protein